MSAHKPSNLLTFNKSLIMKMKTHLYQFTEQLCYKIKCLQLFFKLPFSCKPCFYIFTYHDTSAMLCLYLILNFQSVTGTASMTVCFAIFFSVWGGVKYYKTVLFWIRHHAECDIHL